MIFTLGATFVNSNGVVTVIPVLAGSVPATAIIKGGVAITPTGQIYVVVV